MSGFVYYIACTETHRLKIGFTTGDVEKRLKSLQTGSPTQLVVIAYHPGSIETERGFHEKFASQRIRGEWFEMSEDMFEHVCLVTWLAAKDAIAKGSPIENWIRVGLQTMHDDIAPLPEDLAALLQ